jgi:hypothetical protein
VPILNLLYVSCDCISIYRSPAAYYVEDAESFVYRRRSDDGEMWKVISKGLLEPSGTTITTLASNPKAAGEFYSPNNHGIFISNDSGVLWRGRDIQWPKEYAHILYSTINLDVL